MLLECAVKLTPFQYRSSPSPRTLLTLSMILSAIAPTSLAPGAPKGSSAVPAIVASEKTAVLAAGVCTPAVGLSSSNKVMREDTLTVNTFCGLPALSVARATTR